VSNNSANLQRRDEFVASVDDIENHSTLLYSVDSGISLSLKKLPKRDGSSAFFGTSLLVLGLPSLESRPSIVASAGMGAVSARESYEKSLALLEQRQR
jgi:hypothetical protein